MSSAAPRGGGRISGWLLPLAAMALLGVLAISVRATYRAGPSAATGGGAALLGSAVHVLLLVVVALLELAVLGALVFFPWRRLKDLGKSTENSPRLPWRVVLRLAAIPAAILLIQLLILIYALAHGRRRSASTQGVASSLTPHLAKGGHAASVAPVSLGDATLVAVALGVLAVLLVAFFAIRSRRRRTALSGSEAELSLDLTAGLDQGLEELASGADPRQAVIHAYARMEHSLARSGLARQAQETPLEYLARTLGRIHASRAALARLTDLFETARFSVATVDQRMRQEAEAALAELRREIEQEAAAGG